MEYTLEILVVVRFLTGDRLFRLEYGEAHVAIRAGSVPDQPDNVVQPFVKQRVALYASRSYVERHGAPKDLADMANHFFVGADDPNSRAPFMRWMREHIPAENIVFRSGDFHALRRAIIEGAGIGFMFQLQARELDDMVEILPPQDDWTSPLWLVTHMDLHRTTKVQAFLTVLKEAAKEWENI